MQNISSLEKWLAGQYSAAPSLPEGVKKLIVTWAPWTTLILGLLSLSAAYSLWRMMTYTDSMVNYANSVARMYGAPGTTTDISLFGWLSLVVIVIQAVIYLLAFSGLKARSKKGWDMLFYGLLVSVAYGIVSLFNSYVGFSGLIGSLLGAVIGGYFLFQIRPAYLEYKK
jgi:hypothetical protein